MRIILQVLVLVWTLASLGLGILAFTVVRGIGGSLSAAAQEAFETIPEAAMQAAGSDGAPIGLTIAYWLALATAIFRATRGGPVDVNAQKAGGPSLH